MNKVAITLVCAISITGCANLRSPKFIEAPRLYYAVDCDGESNSYCHLSELSSEYAKYYEGAQNARVITDVTALSAAGGAVIGAATNAHSDLYKATGGILLTAMGFSEYGNFKAQALATRTAASKLSCAAAPLSSLLGLNIPTYKPQSGVAAPAAIAAPVPKANMLKNAPSSEATIALAPAGGSLLVQGVDMGAAVDMNDYETVTSLTVAINNAADNIAVAKRILREINAEATANMVGLQLSVIDQIETNSFKLQDALSVIRLVEPKEVKPTPKAQGLMENELAKGLRRDIIADNDAALIVIDNYNRYIRCMSGDFAPTTFQ